MSVSFHFTRGRLIVVPVRMHVREDLERRPLMTVDTGARLTVITPKLAQELRLEQDGTEPTASITGAVGTARAVVVGSGSWPPCSASVSIAYSFLLILIVLLMLSRRQPPGS